VAEVRNWKVEARGVQLSDQCRHHLSLLLQLLLSLALTLLELALSLLKLAFVLRILLIQLPLEDGNCLRLLASNSRYPNSACCLLSSNNLQPGYRPDSLHLSQAVTKCLGHDGIMVDH
ncbi:hypothetical protein TorRG33x02_219450, partial [Trema orientale]